MSCRLVGTATGLATTTVFGYLARAKAAGLSWPLPKGTDDAALERLAGRARKSARRALSWSAWI